VLILAAASGNLPPLFQIFFGIAQLMLEILDLLILGTQLPLQTFDVIHQGTYLIICGDWWKHDTQIEKKNRNKFFFTSS
jgi:hypothetical protein